MKVILFVIFLFFVLPVFAEPLTGGVEYSGLESEIVANGGHISGYFSDGSYAVNYNTDPLKVFYYSKNRVLTHIEKRSSVEYPYNAYKYDINGNLINLSIRISEDETFIYEPKGQLIAHWVGQNCFDSLGNLIMTREIK
ncbi:hypothetical protein HDR58_00210 [bacterium]|nr:hypothetical protein [bacterium]